MNTKRCITLTAVICMLASSLCGCGEIEKKDMSSWQSMSQVDSAYDNSESGGNDSSDSQEPQITGKDLFELINI